MNTETFSIRNLRLPIEQAISEINARQDISPEDKAFVVGKIQKSGFAGVIVDVHEHFLGGATTLHMTISRLY